MSRGLVEHRNLAHGGALVHLYQPDSHDFWSDASLIALRGLPFWLQTITFKISAAFTLLCLLALAYWLRIRFVAAKLQERHRARLVERDRIVWEIHDTLLQSTEGLMLKVQSVVNQLAPENPQRADLSAALDHAAELAVQGLERMQWMRGDVLRHAELGHVLEKAARAMIQDGGMSFELELQGRVRELRPHVWEQLYRIGYEALCNAIRHAHASRVTVSIGYGDRELLMLIADDGCGIAPAILQSVTKGGLFGLAGMRERARGVKASIRFESGAGSGTRVEIRINDVLAYAA